LEKRSQHAQAIFGSKAAQGTIPSMLGSMLGSISRRVDDFVEVLMNDDIVQVYEAKPKARCKLNPAFERDGHGAQLEAKSERNTKVA
jgi:hypothetical protein